MRHVCWPAIVLALGGCWSEPPRQVVVYTALDSEFSRPIFEDFERETGVHVAARFDTEATKTVGLVNAIIAEAHSPRADVFWNNEIVNTLRLAERGLLEVYQPPAAADYPEMFRDPAGRWHGFAARARVLLVNTQKVAETERPRSIHDLADPRWRGQAGIAKPLFGTTATHAACLFAAWGDERAREYFLQLKQNQIQILASNKQVAKAVSAGQIAFGITDTDDAVIELEQGHPVTIVYPDREPEELGTLFIPNTLCLVKGAPHAADARVLIDYLLGSEVEVRLARGPSAQIPLSGKVDPSTARVATPRSVKAMQVDFAAAARSWDTAAAFIRQQFTQ
jgi:iron(III) transport system substrate-binding protein